MMFLDDQDCREESKIKYFSHLLALLKEVFGMLTILSYYMKKILWHVKVRVVSASNKIYLIGIFDEMSHSHVREHNFVKTS